MDKWTQAQIANQQAIEQAAREAERVAHERMVGAVALENAKRARDQAAAAARERQHAQEAHNRTQGFFDNWR